MKQNSKTALTADNEVADFTAMLLEWYRLNGRELPWRAPFGEKADPYHEWLSEIMLQQTVVKAVIPYFLRFIERWPHIESLAAADREEVLKEWAGLGYYSRARNLHKCAQIITETCNGRFPEEEGELRKLPGIGLYTAAAIAAIAFHKPAVVVDGNVERVVSRLFALKSPLRNIKKDLREKAASIYMPGFGSSGDFAQAMMDLGAVICTPRSPKCDICPVKHSCVSRKKGLQNSIPVRAAKQSKPVKYGVLYFIEDGRGNLLFEKRKDEGLLGGMTGLPGTYWSEDKTVCSYEGMLKSYNLKHTFTHFHLELQGLTNSAKNLCYNLTERNFWYPIDEYDKLSLPTLYQKAIKLYLKEKGKKDHE